MTKKNIEKTYKVWEKEFKKGFSSYIILKLLNDKDMYGYEIKAKLDEILVSDVQFQESGIYQNLKKLKSKKFVTSEIRKSEVGPKRKYYIITKSGIELLKTFTDHFIYPVSKSIVEMIESEKKKGDLSETANNR
ncbi:MAG: PadR family transcriptional regulator [Candidatus Delongbacteria bacterium]|nr:PadR family transcriptional regulator [Candidatus Delongbacteria bacterium]